MQPVLRTSSHCHVLSRFTHSRSLTTFPRRVPRFSNPWNPADRSQTAEHNKSPPSRVAVDYHALRKKNAAKSEARGLKTDESIARRHAVRRLNECLKLTKAGHAEAEVRPRLWRAYSLAKSHDARILARMTPETWNILWTSQSIRFQFNPVARAHLMELYRDMLSMGITPTTRQKISYMQCMFLVGKEEEALEEWEACYESVNLSGNRANEPMLMATGAKMYAFAGNGDRARQIARELYTDHPLWDTGVMMAVFRAYTRSSEGEHHETAFRIYRKIKTMFKTKESAKTGYNSCFIGFIEARQLGFAKSVLADMVKDGHLAQSYSDEDISEVLQKLHLLYRLAGDAVKSTSIALRAITVLPPAYHSRVFADWLKAIVVRRIPQAAAQILEVMGRRRHGPETIHFNLFLRALFETREREMELKAENIGWQMVDALRRSQPNRQRFSDARDIRKFLNSSPSQSANSFQKVPPANAVTFALLMQYHGDRDGLEHVDYLSRQLKQMDIAPNEEIMNTWMNIQCRQGNYNEVWRIYKSLTNVAEGERGVFPNGASFRCLWRTLRLALGDDDARENSTLPSPRELLAENIKWWDLVRRRFDSNRFRSGLDGPEHGALNSLVMHCFSYTTDLPGSLVAIFAMRDCFGLMPSNKSANILHQQVAWVDLHGQTQSFKAQYSKSGVPKQKMLQIIHIYNILIEGRLKRKNITAEQYADMQAEKKADIMLDTLAEFIRAILKRQQPPEVVEEMIDQAKQEIGLPQLYTGDMDAFAVS